MVDEQGVLGEIVTLHMKGKLKVYFGVIGKWKSGAELKEVGTLYLYFYKCLFDNRKLGIDCE